MKATHCLKTAPEETVTAWQFSKTAPIPAWVARRFHWMGGKWSSLSNHGQLVQAKETDWAVCIANKVIIVLSHEEFTTLFKKV